MPSSLCLFFLSEMRCRELLNFGSSVSPQVTPIQGNVLAGHWSCLLTSFASTQKIPVILAPEPFSPSQRKSNSMTEPWRLNKQLCLNKEGKKGRESSWSKSVFSYLCFAVWLQQITSLWACTQKNSLCVMCATKGSAKPSPAQKQKSSILN